MENLKKTEIHKLALAIDPFTRGFGYALFEGPKTPLDWGVTDIRSEKNQISLERVKKLISFYQPEILILEDCSKSRNRRCRRIRDLIAQIEKFADSRKVPVQKYSFDRVQEVFSFLGIRTKHRIAETICEWLPELNSRIPPKRKPWMSEDRRMSIFDAVALILTYYYLEE